MKNQSISRDDGRSRKSQGGGWYAVSIATVFLDPPPKVVAVIIPN